MPDWMCSRLGPLQWGNLHGDTVTLRPPTATGTQGDIAKSELKASYRPQNGLSGCTGPLMCSLDSNRAGWAAYFPIPQWISLGTMGTWKNIPMGPMFLCHPAQTNIRGIHWFHGGAPLGKSPWLWAFNRERDRGKHFESAVKLRASNIQESLTSHKFNHPSQFLLHQWLTSHKIMNNMFKILIINQIFPLINIPSLSVNHPSPYCWYYVPSGCGDPEDQRRIPKGLLCQVGEYHVPPPVTSWYINPINIIVITTINHRIQPLKEGNWTLSTAGPTL